MNKQSEILKYAALGLMGLYVIKKYEGAGFGNHYLTAQQKADNLVNRLTDSLPIQEQHKNMAKTVLKGAASKMIDDHLGVRVIK